MREISEDSFGAPGFDQYHPTMGNLIQRLPKFNGAIMQTSRGFGAEHQGLP